MNNTVRLNKLLRELNITTNTAAATLANNGQLIDPRPTTKLTEQQVEILRNEFKEVKYKPKESIDFEIGQHYEFEIRENRDNFTIINSIGNLMETYTSERIYEQPGKKVKLFVKSFKDNGEPVLKYSVLNSYVLYQNYVFDANMAPKENGYLLENNEYHEHFVPLAFKSLIEGGTIKLKVSEIDLKSNKLLFDDSGLKQVNISPASGRDAFMNGIDYKFEVIGYKEDYYGENNLIELKYKEEEYTTKALGFQKEYGLPKWMYCTVNKEQNFRLYQNLTRSYLDEFNPQEKYTFTIIDKKLDDNEAPYYLIKDKIGFIHRFYKNQAPLETLPEIGDAIQLFVVELNEKSKHLKLDWYVEDFNKYRDFYSPDKIFSEISNYSVEEHLYNLQEFIDLELERLGEDNRKPPYLELFSQIEKENNNWFFSYLSLLSEYNNTLIKQGKYEKAKKSIHLYIDLEEWLLDSDFINEYSQAKKQEIIDNAESIAEKQEDLLTLIEVLESKKHYKKLDQINSNFQKRGVISSKDLQKTIEYLSWDKTLLTSHYDLIYSIIHKLLDSNKKEQADLSKLNQITGLAYDSTFANRNFVLTSGVQEFSEVEKKELETENKHLFIQIRLNEVLGSCHYAVLKSAELLRNLALLSTEASLKKKYLLNSIDVIIKQVPLKTLLPKDFFNLNELSIKVAQILDVEVSEQNTLYYYNKSGVIINTDKGWLFSNQLTSFNENLESKEAVKTILSLYDDRISLGTNPRTEKRYESLNPQSTNFWGTYINNRKSLNENLENLSSIILKDRLHSIRSVVKSLDYLISLEANIDNKIIALQLAKLITSILKDNKSFYYGEMLQLYYRITDLKSNINSDYEVNDETLEKFPVLKKIENLHALINLIGTDDDKDINLFLESEYSSIRSITKIISAYNNVKLEFPNCLDIHENLMALIEVSFLKKALFIETPSMSIENIISNNTFVNTEELVINKGREDIITEFKTSIVYHPGSKEPHIENQTSQIIKVITGFLNARGGKLYLGIKDNGTLVGLQSDYSQLNANSDVYERLIRSYVIKYTNNTVNGLLEFKFENEEALEYLIINIPASTTLIDFNGEFYQRQGADTRLIKGQDLTRLMREKLEIDIVVNKPKPKQDKQVEMNFISEESTVYQKNKISPKEGILEKAGNYKISIFNDRSWVWSDAGKDFDFGSSLDFTIKDKDSYLLICYSEGRLAKFRTRSFLSRNKNEKQCNTFGLRPDSEIVNIFEIKEDINFLVQSAYEKEVYLKIINSSEAGDVRNRLASQGTYFIDSNNDGILSIKPIDLSDLDSQYDKLQMSKQTRGVCITSDKIAELVNELKLKNYL
jgi:hypothetical protein